MSAAAALSPSLGVVVAGGGTGGHLFPGIALAQQFAARHPETRVLFVGTGRPFEAAAVHRAGFTHRTVTAEGIKRRGWRRAGGMPGRVGPFEPGGLTGRWWRRYGCSGGRQKGLRRLVDSGGLMGRVDRNRRGGWKRLRLVFGCRAF